MKTITLTYERLVEICQKHYTNPREQISNFVRDHEWQGEKKGRIDREARCTCNDYQLENYGCKCGADHPF